MTRQLHLNAFIMETGHHEASWRHPDSSVERVSDFRYYQEVAKKAEAAKLDAVFLADGPTLTHNTGSPAYRPGHALEPITLLTAVATATERIGLIATASTTFHEPYNLARLFNTLDQVSQGRAAWNIVTTHTRSAAQNFGLDEIPDPSTRYARAQEFVDVVTRLWDSWEDDAVVADRASGLYLDPAKVHEIDYVGRYLKVKGPFNQRRSPQGRPVYVQAGSSNDGRAFAARNAEAIFTAHQQIADARAFYADIKSRTVGYGRSADQVLILPGLSPYIGATEKEAQELYRSFNDLTVPEYGIAQLETLADVSFRELDLDDKVPLHAFGSTGSVLDNNRSRKQVVAGIVERERPTLRELLHRLAGARGHNVVVGTPVQVADTIQEWFEQGAADGFNIMPPLYPQGLDAFTSTVVPILQERGLFRTDYTGETLRDHYGLPRPESLYADRRVAAGS